MDIKGDIARRTSGHSDLSFMSPRGKKKFPSGYVTFHADGKIISLFLGILHSVLEAFIIKIRGVDVFLVAFGRHSVNRTVVSLFKWLHTYNLIRHTCQQMFLELAFILYDVLSNTWELT